MRLYKPEYVDSAASEINNWMLICVACGNGSFEYRIEPSKQGGTDYA